jgi:hypothetical protein
MLLGLQSCITSDASSLSKGCVAEDPARCKIQLLKESCRETLENYAYLRDHLQYQDYGALFAEDATFQIGEGAIAKGRDKIVEALRDRGPRIPTRHFTNITSMNVLNASTLEALSYVNVYKVPRNDGTSDIQPKLSPWIIGEYYDRLQMEGGRCVISSRKVELVSRED